MWMITEKILPSSLSLSRGGDRQINRVLQNCPILGSGWVCGAERKEVLTSSEASGDGGCLEKLQRTIQGRKRRNSRNVENLAWVVSANNFESMARLQVN